jgi:hypothetical protein
MGAPSPELVDPEAAPVALPRFHTVEDVGTARSIWPLWTRPRSALR